MKHILYIFILTFLLLAPNESVAIKKRFCTSCGYELSFNSWRCYECGARVGTNNRSRFGSIGNGIMEAHEEHERIEQETKRHKRELANERRIKRMELKHQEEEAEKERELEKELFEAELAFKREQERKKAKELKEFKEKQELEKKQIKKEQTLKEIEELKEDLFVTNQLLSKTTKSNTHTKTDQEITEEEKKQEIKKAFDFYFNNVTSILKKPYSDSTRKPIDCHLNLIYAEALLRLLPSSDKTNVDKYKKILQLKKQIQSIIPSGLMEECTKCGNDGYIDFKYLKPDNEIGIKENSVPCPLCKTKKQLPFVLGKEDIECAYLKSQIELKRQILEDETMLLFFKKQIIEHFTIREKINYARASALPCENCFGFKVVQCKKCEGLGQIKCTLDSCNDGYRGNDEDSNIGTDAIYKLQRCHNCNGLTYSKCKECNEKGYLSCAYCRGTGEKNKCNTCHGNGYLNCTACNTNNTNKEQCDLCNDEKIILCKTCDGAGVK